MITSLHVFLGGHLWQAVVVFSCFFSWVSTVETPLSINFALSETFLKKSLKKWCSTCFKGIQLGLYNKTFFKIFLRIFFLSQTQVKLVEVSCFTRTAVLKFKNLFYGFLINILYHTWPSSMFYQVSIDAVSSATSYMSRKAFSKISNQWSNFVSFATFIIFCVIGKM